jgi:D-alanyl-D-alanine carboxypeptidase (penicillin-binding protein 5/6)
VQVTVPRGQAAAVTSSATVRQPLVAPLAADIAIGELQVTLAGRTVSTVPLYPAQAVPEGGLWRRLVDTILLWF